MNKQLKEMIDFIKESMCIDGTVELLTTNEIPYCITNKQKEKLILEGAIFECRDKKRGTFYIGWYKNIY